MMTNVIILILLATDDRSANGVQTPINLNQFNFVGSSVWLTRPLPKCQSSVEALGPRTGQRRGGPAALSEIPIEVVYCFSLPTYSTRVLWRSCFHKHRAEVDISHLH